MSEESQGKIPNVGFNYAELEARYLALFAKDLRSLQSSLDRLIAMWTIDTKGFSTKSTIADLKDWVDEKARKYG